MEQAPKGTAQLRERTKIGLNANKFIPVAPSSNEIRRECAIATIAPKIMYNTISILFLSFLIRFFIIMSIKIEDGIPKIITMGTIYSNPIIRPLIKLLNNTCSYEVSMVTPATTKLPNKEETSTGMTFFYMMLLSY